MGNPQTLRACVIAGALGFSSVAGVLAQGGFQISGRLKTDEGGLDGARVIVYKNGEKQRSINNGLSKFSLDLDLNADYILEFEKDGFVTKKLSFDTHAPAEAIANGFTPFEFAVSLFKQYDDVSTVVFNQPVGMIRYDKNADDFDYDTDYTKSIQSALEKTMQEVAAKQEQEKGNAAAEASRAQEEAKAKARSDAEKAKQEAEAAKQKAKGEKEAAEAAERAQQQMDADAKKTEAAAKKADQDRLAAVAKEKAAAPKPAPKAKPPVAPKADPPPPVAKAEKPKSPERPSPPPPTMNKVNGNRQQPKEGADMRKGLAPKVDEESSPVKTAAATEMIEAKPAPREVELEIVRNEELIVEPNQVILRIELDHGGERTEYRKVVHKFGPTFYFKDGLSISKLIYESEALAENN